MAKNFVFVLRVSYKMEDQPNARVFGGFQTGQCTAESFQEAVEVANNTQAEVIARERVFSLHTEVVSVQLVSF